MKYSGVIFDLDGTLTVPNLDFAVIRSRLGLGPRADILGSVTAMAADRQAWAHKLIIEWEQEALLGMQLQPGAADLLRELRETALPMAIVTRNNAAAVHRLFEVLGDVDDNTKSSGEFTEAFENFTVVAHRSAIFDVVLSRDCGLPVKPAPHAIHFIMKKWQLDEPHKVLFVGDGAHDLDAGRAAGCRTVLLRHDANQHVWDHASADHTIDQFIHLKTLLY